MSLALSPKKCRSNQNKKTNAIAEMHDMVLGGGLLDLHANGIPTASLGYRLLIDLDARHVADDQIVLVRNAQRCPRPQLPSQDLAKKKEHVQP